MNAANGRFWNADSYEGRDTDPKSPRNYLYSNGDPVNLSKLQEAANEK